MVEVGPEVSKHRVGDVVGVGVIVGCCRECRPCKANVEQYCNKRICPTTTSTPTAGPRRAGSPPPLSSTRSESLKLLRVTTALIVQHYLVSVLERFISLSKQKNVLDKASNIWTLIWTL